MEHHSLIRIAVAAHSNSMHVCCALRGQSRVHDVLHSCDVPFRKAVVHAPVQHGDVVCVGRCRIGLALHVMREMAVAWSQMLMINGGSSRRQ